MTPLLYLTACLMSPAPLIHLAESRVLRPLKKKGFKEKRVTTIGLYDIGKSHDPGIQQEPVLIGDRLNMQMIRQRCKALDEKT